MRGARAPQPFRTGGPGALESCCRRGYDRAARPDVVLAKSDMIIGLIMEAFGAAAAGYVCLRMLERWASGRQDRGLGWVSSRLG